MSAASLLTGSRAEVLRAVCDTVVPAIERAPDPHGHWARSASSCGVPEAMARALESLPADQQQGMALLLDVLGAQGLVAASQPVREELLRNLSLASSDAATGIAALTRMTLLVHYCAPDPVTGRNPGWDLHGYPGPISAPPQTPKPIEPLQINADTTLRADVVVVGSGAGGGVIAAGLAARGASVVVVEAGGYYNEADFTQQELWGWQNLYWRGGPTPTADRNVGLLAGSCLGGGTVVNWTNCLRSKPWVRREWAAEHGLSDVVAEDFDRHLDAVWSRLSVNAECSELNKPNQMLKRGAEALGWSFQTVTRNTERSSYDPVSAGYMGFGDQSGSKQSITKTYLLDAFRAGARIVTGCFVDRVTTRAGRATGVLGRSLATGAELIVQAPHVVLAAGGLESPALLLRSGIGGPAAGRYLRLHPVAAVVGAYDEEMAPWWGAPQAGLIDEFAAGDDGYGFMIECANYAPGMAAATLPWLDARQHKQTLEDLGDVGVSVALTRDRGDANGWVQLDANDMAQPFYALRDEADQATVREGIAAQIRCHAAAGAHQISVLADQLPTWNRGDDLEDYTDRAQDLPLGAGGVQLAGLHQMGTCRMGIDPATSVAGPTGELHDTAGVWIGDASAFPTASGTNPMITIMALAHRTAEHLATAAGATLEEAR